VHRKADCISVPICFQSTAPGPVLSLFFISVVSQLFSTLQVFASVAKNSIISKAWPLSLVHYPWMHGTISVLSVPLGRSSVPLSFLLSTGVFLPGQPTDLAPGLLAPCPGIYLKLEVLQSPGIQLWSRFCLLLNTPLAPQASSRSDLRS